MDLRARAGRAVSHLRYVTRTVRGLVQHPGYEGTRVTPRRMANLILNRWEHRALRTDAAQLAHQADRRGHEHLQPALPRLLHRRRAAGARARTPVARALRPDARELGPYLWRVEFCNWGEPLLGKHIFPMIEAATARGISSLISTNFSVPFDAERAERLVASGLTVLGVSLDGAQAGDLRAVSRARQPRDRAAQLPAGARRQAEAGLDDPEAHLVVPRLPPQRRGRRAGARHGGGARHGVRGREGLGGRRRVGSRRPLHLLRQPASLPVRPALGVRGGEQRRRRRALLRQLLQRGRHGTRIAATDDAGARTFREVWNGPRSAAPAASTPGATATRRHATRSASTARRPSSGSAGSTTWAEAALEQDFDPGFSQNDVFNYFWNRQKLHRPAGDPPRAARGGRR